MIDENAMKEIKKSILLDLAKGMQRQVMESSDSEESSGYCEDCGSKMQGGSCPECGPGESEEMDDEAPEFPKAKPKGGKTLVIDILSAAKPMTEMTAKKGRK